ncbi:FliM/FliN family flagellar motor switch protein (plasmid) [Pontibacillus sp. ALD_SL1]|uniref:FliM/FliN family flagellar motor switch protein n=1 Tax=Pontibacillus sp. ALD_SL1 TaxID=2777185 RepID=UPI001A97C5D5|nr:FliM/FliN family flagellar motor switch protein [Pontibacillus sp. ALD_SL1]QST03045.1 FliM/FliN family flagellar motor switch protein [Pontibacillus sp. ALD_SL1]
MSKDWIEDEDLQQVFGTGEEGVEVQEVEFQEFEETQERGDAASLELLYDLPVEIRVLFGSVELYIEEITNLKEKDVIPLDKLAGEPVDVLAGGVLIAKGKVVVNEEHFGVIISEVLPPKERLQRLRKKLL